MEKDLAVYWREKIQEDCNQPGFMGIILEGDSMEPRFYEGDVLIVLRELEAHSDCYAVCKLLDGRIIFRWVEFAPPNRVKLVPVNVRYVVDEFERSDFEWICPVYEHRRMLYKNSHLIK